MLRYAVVAIGLLTIIGVSGSAMVRHDKKVAATYGLASEQVWLMNDCKASFRSHHKHFNELIGVERGCACIAQRLSVRTETSHLKAAAAALHLLLYASDTGPQDTRAVSKIFDVPAKSVNANLDLSLEALTYCGAISNHPGRIASRPHQ